MSKLTPEEIEAIRRAQKSAHELGLGNKRTEKLLETVDELSAELQDANEMLERAETVIPERDAWMREYEIKKAENQKLKAALQIADSAVNWANEWTPCMHQELAGVGFLREKMVDAIIRVREIMEKK